MGACDRHQRQLVRTTNYVQKDPNCPTLAGGVLAAKHVFAALPHVDDIIMLPAGTVLFEKNLKRL